MECFEALHFYYEIARGVQFGAGLFFGRCHRSKLTRCRASGSIVATIKSVHRSVLLLAAASSSFAQVAPVAPQPAKTPPLQAAAPQPARPAPSVPRVISTPARAAQTPAPAAPANPQPGAPQMVRLQFPNSDVTDVLHLYEQLTGKKLVMDNFVQGKVNIFISKDVPREEAIKIIEMNLLLNGYSLIPAEDTDIVKVIGTGKNPRTTGVPIVSDETEIPDGDHVISYLFKLRYADPTELQQALGQYLSPPQPYTSFLALPKAGAILVTENSSVIRTLARIINQVDVPPAEVVSEFIKLERADASKVVDMLKDIFEKGDKTGTQPGQPGYRGGVRPVGAGNVPAQVAEVSEVGGLTALTEESVVVGKIKLSADVRTNRIHVITRPVNMPFLRKLIAEFDANVEFAKPVTRALNYISAADVLPVIVQALTEPGQAGGGAEGGQPAVPGASPGQPRRTTPATSSTGGFANASTTSGTGTYGGSSSTSGTLNISEELSTQPVDTTPKAVTIGNAKIIADQRANTIIMLGNQEVVVKVQKILDEMDVKAPQVALSTVIGELTLNNDEEFGIDYFAKYDRHVVGTSRNTGVPIPLPAASASAAPIGVIDPAHLINFQQIISNVATGTNVYVAAGNYLSMIVHALEGTGRFRVINRPVVFTSNNKKAIIASGTEVPVPVNTVTAPVGVTNINNGLGQQSNIEFKRIALQLEVVPLINSEREVSLDILQKVDSIAGSTIVNGNSIPNIATRYVRTSVTAPNGSTIVLGGLITDSKKKDTTGIPVLDRIPYLGSLFRNTVTNRMRSELIILMCPEVTMTNLEMQKLREKIEDHTHFGAEIDQGYCPDCPPRATEEKQLPGQLPPPDLPFGKTQIKSK
jgi:general secretion pathway protein D